METLECIIEWKDNKERQHVLIRIDSGYDPEADDDIFFYCDSYADLEGLKNPENCEDFVLIDVLG